MTTRPYFHHSVDQLRAAIEEHWSSVPDLQEVFRELQHRSTARAQRLERDAGARLLALGASLDSNANGRESQAKRKAEAKSQTAGTSSREDPRLQELTMRALRAEQQVRDLESQLRVAEAELARVRADSGKGEEDLYAKVGLHRSCPDFLIKVAKRAFRKEFHPDALSDRPSAEQHAAQEKFKEFEQLFSRIEAMRQ